MKGPSLTLGCEPVTEWSLKRVKKKKKKKTQRQRNGYKLGELVL